MTLLFVQKEERPILPDRSANLTAVAVVPPFWLGDSQEIPKPVVRVQLVILVIPVAGAVPVIRASLCNHLNFGTSRTCEIRSGIISRHAEFF